MNDTEILNLILKDLEHPFEANTSAVRAALINKIRKLREYEGEIND